MLHNESQLTALYMILIINKQQKMEKPITEINNKLQKCYFIAKLRRKNQMIQLHHPIYLVWNQRFNSICYLNSLRN